MFLCLKIAGLKSINEVEYQLWIDATIKGPVDTGPAVSNRLLDELN